jgi:predicted metalloprotease with PDZ domain
VSLETLVDSPVYAGRHYRRVELDPPGTPRPVTLHIFGDSPERLLASEAQIDAHRRLVQQALALFGSRPWRHYDLLLAIGDGLPETALEHHESSENVYTSDYFKDWASAARRRDDLAHEFIHAWNGKYRRPADLWAPDFNTPSQNSLLWVYEGLTQYYGMVIAARSGIVAPELTRRQFGRSAAFLRDLAGRRWRNLQDTTNDPAMASSSERTWYDWQRGEDYYYESAVLIWLDADTLIRSATGGTRSLDDVARRFFNGPDGERGPKLYTFDDVVGAMNAVYANDWKAFFRERLDRTAAQVPLDGLERAGWRLVFAGKRSEMDLAALNPRKPMLGLNYSLGLIVGNDGKLDAVVWDGPAFRAGLAPQDQIVAVAMRAYSGDRLEAAIAANQDGSRPIDLLVKHDDEYRSVKLDVRTGLRYPALEPIAGRPDELSAILKAR